MTTDALAALRARIEAVADEWDPSTKTLSDPNADWVAIQQAFVDDLRAALEH